MKISILVPGQRKGESLYITKLLEKLVSFYGHELTSPEESELIGVSLTHWGELKGLKKTRETFPSKKIVVGGHLSHSPLPLLRWADFVNLGHGFQFFKECRSIDDIWEKEYIIHSQKKNGKFSQYIDWKIVPAVQIQKNSYSYCLTSWINKYQINPQKRIPERIRKAIGKSKQLYLITNDFSDSCTKRTTTNALLRDFLKNPRKFEKIRYIRVGVEFVSEKLRNKLAKPMTDEEIREFVIQTKKCRKRANIFLIAGLNSYEEFEEFGEKVLNDEIYEFRPRLGFIVNYLSPQLNTPLEQIDLTKLKEVDLDTVRYKWKLKNGRVVVFHSDSLRIFNALKDAICERSDENQIEKVLALRKRRFKTTEEFWEEVEKMGLMSLAKGNFLKIKLELPYKYSPVSLEEIWEN